MLRIVLVLLCLAQANIAFGTTYYVDNRCATSGNGTTTNCGANGPFNSFHAIQCGGSGRPGPGDTIDVRGGTGLYLEPTRWNVPTGCVGQAGNPIVIQNYPNETAIYDGSLDIRGSTWTSQGGGIWKCTGGTCGTDPNTFPWTAWYQLTPTSAEQRLNLIQSKSCSSGVGTGCPGRFVCDSSVGVNQITYDGSHQQVCAHLSDGSSPASAVYFRIPMAGDCIDLFDSNINYMTLQSNPAGGALKVRRCRDYGISLTPLNDHGISILGMEISEVMNRCINETGTGNSAAGNKFDGNTVHDCGQEGIRPDSDTGAWEVKNNTVYNVQVPPEFEQCFPNCLNNYTDNGTAIRAAVSGGVISGNTVHDVGGGNAARAYAIDVEGGRSNVLIDSNLIYNVSVGTSLSFQDYTGGVAILISEGGTQSGNAIRNNRIHHVGSCFVFEAGSAAATGSGNTIVNNTCSEPLVAGIFGIVQPGDWGATTTFMNNIFVSTTSVPSQGFFNIPSSGFSGLQRPTSSAYYCAQCAPGTTLFSFKGDRVLTASNDSSTQTNVQSFESASFYGNPNVSQTGMPPSLTLTSCSGTACDHGQTASGFSVDFQGTPRPQGAAWDIGADEYSAGVVALAPPTLLNVQPVP